MSERFISLDPWASRRPRRRDWLLLVTGALALLAAMAGVSGVPDAAPRSVARPMSAARMQQIEAQTAQLNQQIVRLEQP